MRRRRRAEGDEVVVVEILDLARLRTLLEIVGRGVGVECTVNSRRRMRSGWLGSRRRSATSASRMPMSSSSSESSSCSFTSG